jgi:hypothetical protein
MKSGALLIQTLLAAAALAQELPAPPEEAAPVPQEAAPVPQEAAPADLPPETPEAMTERMTSRSEQFRVGGGNRPLRGSVAVLAEEIKDELLDLTGEADTWRDAAPRVPISIFLSGEPGDPVPPRTVALSLSFSEAGYELRLDVHLSRGIEHARFRSAITTALLYERALRGRVAEESEVPFIVPPWLVEGLLEAVDWRKRRADRRPYETLFKSGGVFHLDDLFALTEQQHAELDGAMRTGFRVSSGALVMALLEQPDGKEGIGKFLAAVAAYQGEMPSLLRQHFPGMNLSDTSMAKWWALQMASKSTAALTDVMSISETEATLNDALNLQFRDVDGLVRRIPLNQWAELPERSPAELAEAIRPVQDALVKLSYRCFPPYRPFLGEYQLALAAIAARTTSDTAARLARLEESRTNLLTRAERARDFMDWFEITRARETSGAFDDYLLLKARLKEEAQRRDDPLSLYLDRLERVFTRAEGSRTASATP